jgi:cellulose synthase/poly-beta-1,6-N-acetylglucosamine synthase-like glycosyltransferase
MMSNLAPAMANLLVLAWTQHACRRSLMQSGNAVEARASFLVSCDNRKATAMKDSRNPMATEQAGIIIPVRNGAATLAACLDACFAQTVKPADVIVVDDGSTDNSAAIARDKGARVVVQAPSGPAAARNRGAKEAAWGVIAFTDADCIPQPDWLERLLEAFEPGVDGVGGAYANANPDKWLSRMIQQEILLRHEKMQGEVDFLGSFNAAFRREAFMEMGGFDEDFKAASAEDNDLSYRMRDAGYALRFAPNAVVAHNHPERLWPYLRTQGRHGFWRMKLYAKHPKRAGGDRYAGKADLYAPGLLLILILMAFAGPAAYFFSPAWFLQGYCVLFVLAVSLYLGLRLPPSIRMARTSGDWRMIEFGDVAALRDAARALGMLSGIWHFHVLRRRKA